MYSNKDIHMSQHCAEFGVPLFWVSSVLFYVGSGIKFLLPGLWGKYFICHFISLIRTSKYIVMYSNKGLVLTGKNQDSNIVSILLADVRTDVFHSQLQTKDSPEY